MSNLESTTQFKGFCKDCRFWDSGNWVKDLECRCFCEANKRDGSIFATAPFHNCEYWEGVLEELSELEK